MPFTDLAIKRRYRSGRDMLLDDFYIPCLSEALYYDRAVGYFSSTIIQVAAAAYSDFVDRGGQMRLVCSPALSPQDFSAMKEAEFPDRYFQEQIRRELHTLLANPQAVPATRLLATLMRSGVLEVRLAFSLSNPGRFHEKTGIFEDDRARRISFVGSSNETWAGWGLNHEAFEAFRSWSDEIEMLRTRDHADAFEDLWNSREEGVSVRTLDDVTREELDDIAESSIDAALFAARSTHPVEEGHDQHTASKPLLPHQRAVLESWEQHDRHGVINFATGVGKTITAIEAIRRWASWGGASLVAVPSKELHRQWVQELEKEIPSCNILEAGAGHPKRVWHTLLSSFTGPTRSSAAPQVVVVTNATLTKANFSRRLRQGNHLLLIADEMHRAGSTRTLPSIEAIDAGARLGLTATYTRAFDQRGTDRLLQYFGPILQPSVGIAEAILMGRLVPYDYRLHFLSLDADEVSDYEDLTRQIRQQAAREPEAGELTERLKSILIRRARILKQARVKVPRSVEVLSCDYEEGQRWLVYCDDVQQLEAVVAGCKQAGLPAVEYHSGMISRRADVLKSFEIRGGIVVAVRCLDEGVDIPNADHALILASSTSEREYIQRRGRVLRSADRKYSAEIHDLLLTDSNGGVLTRTEGLRALEFCQLARNRSATERLRLALALSQDPSGLPPVEDDEDEDED